ncbi:MAG: acyltransferase [Ornithinibacter sp.]
MSSTTITAPPRSAPGAHYLLELEGLRALAAVAVLLTHAGFLSGATSRSILPGFLARMDIGVAVFFVLSGLLLYRPHARRLVLGDPPPDRRSYAIRRAARLVPAWLAVLLGTLVLVPESRTAGSTVWVANLLQLQSLRMQWDIPGLSQLWSLSTEVMFYIALPFLALLLARIAARGGPRRHLMALLGVACGSWLFRAAVGFGLLPEGFSWARTLPAVADWFVVGMVLAVITSDESLRRPVAGVVRAVPWHLYGLAACVFWVLTTRAAGPYDLAFPTAGAESFKHLGYTLVAALVVIPSALGAHTLVSRVLAHPVLTYVGTVSYGLFLWHLPVMFAVRRILGLGLFDSGFWITVVLTLSASLLIASLSWYLLEAPIQAWARRRTGGGIGGPAPGPRRDDRHEQERQPS